MNGIIKSSEGTSVNLSSTTSKNYTTFKGFDHNSSHNQVQIPSVSSDYSENWLSKKDAIGNTRLITESGLEAHLDYLRIKFCCSGDELKYLFSYLDPVGAFVQIEMPWSPGGGSYYYENSISSSLGIAGGVSITEETGENSVMLEFSGTYFEGLSNEDVWRTIAFLRNSYGAEATRIDLTIDDRSYQIVPKNEMIKAWKDGNNYGFRTYKVVGSGTSIEDFKTTSSFGSRQSGKMVRVYDHKGLFLRFEAEFKRGYSKAIFNLLADISKEYDLSEGSEEPAFIKAEEAISKFHEAADKSTHIRDLEINFSESHACNKDNPYSSHGCNNNFEMSFAQIIASIAVSTIDFRDKSKLKDKTRANKKECPRLEFWQKFIDKIKVCIKIRLPKPIHSIQKTLAWIEKNWSRSLAILYKAVGKEYLENYLKGIIKKGVNRLLLKDKKLIATLKENPEYLSVSCPS